MTNGVNINRPLLRLRLRLGQRMLARAAATTPCIACAGMCWRRLTTHTYTTNYISKTFSEAAAGAQQSTLSQLPQQIIIILNGKQWAMANENNIVARVEFV